MRKPHAIIYRILAGLFCFFLSACFEVHEEIWVHRDGSGRGEFTYTVPQSAIDLGGGQDEIEQKIRALIAKNPPLAIEHISFTTAPDETIVSVAISTSSLLALRKIADSNKGSDTASQFRRFAGDFDIQIAGLDIDFSRTINVRKALGLASFAVGGSDRKNRHLTYIVHLPNAAKSSNATSTEDEGRTLIWEKTLGDALKKPLTTHFHAAMPIPWWGYASLVILTVGIIALVWWVLKKCRNHSRKSLGNPS